MSRPVAGAPSAAGRPAWPAARLSGALSLGLPGPIRRLAFGTAFLSFASSFLWPLNTIYVHEVLGRSLTAAGLALLVQAASSALASVVGGHLYDLRGGRPTIVAGAAIGALGALAIGVFPGFPAYVAALAVVGFGSGLVAPALNALAGELWREGGRKAFNAVYVSRNAGVALGASAGGLVAGYDFRAVFFTNAALVALFALYAALRFPDPRVRGAEERATGADELAAVAADPAAAGGARGRGEPPDSAPIGGAMSAPVLRALADRRLLLLALGFFLAQTAYTQWTTTVAAHMQALGFAVARYSALWTLNGALILMGQPLVSQLSRRVPDVGCQILIGTGAYVAVFVALVWARGYALFVGLMALLTFGEMLVWPGVPAAADRIAPAGRRGAYQGVVEGGSSLGRMLGPVAGGLAYDLASPQATFAAMAGVLVLAAGAFWAAGRGREGGVPRCGAI